MKKNYSRWSSIVLIAFIYLLAAVAGVEVFVSLTQQPQPLVDNPIMAADLYLRTYRSMTHTGVYFRR